MDQVANYIEKAKTLMPHFAHELTGFIEDHMTLDQISDAAFSQSEYIGGMADVIVAIVKSES